MELTFEIRLPERLDRDGLATFRSNIEAMDGAAVATIRGATDGIFCRGLALDNARDVSAAERDAGLADFEAAAMTLVTSSTRTIARVDGDALGGGLGIASACDVVIASDTARFGLPEPLFGLIPGLVMPLIRSRITGPALRRMALGGDSISAHEAHRIGLVDEVVTNDQLDLRISAWARRMCRAEPGATHRLKQWLADMDGLATNVARGRTHLAELLGSEVVAQRVSRYNRGLAPWQDEDASA